MVAVIDIGHCMIFIGVGIERLLVSSASLDVWPPSFCTSFDLAVVNIIFIAGLGERTLAASLWKWWSCAMEVMLEAVLRYRIGVG
jgi:hypothetical protein